MRKTLLFLMLSITFVVAADISPLAIGAAAPDFQLPAIDGKTYELSDFDADILVFIFTATHCPTAQAYEERIVQLVQDYESRGVQFVAVAPNYPDAVCLEELGYTDLDDSFEHTKIRAQEAGFTFPYLFDGEKQSMSKAYGPAATPHVFIFDTDRKLRYHGRIDDTENPYVKPTQQDARNALDALLAGKPVPVEVTKTFGCSIKWASKVEWKQKLQQEWEAKPVTLESIDVDGIKEILKNDSENYLLVNIWATWCGPCIIEFPEFVKMYRMYKNRNFDMVSISADKANAGDKVLKFLQDKHAAFRNYHYQGEDSEALINAVDPEWQGAIPYTLLVAPGGKIVYKHMGLIEPLEVKKAIVEKIGRFFADD